MGNNKKIKIGLIINIIAIIAIVVLIGIVFNNNSKLNKVKSELNETRG